MTEEIKREKAYTEVDSVLDSGPVPSEHLATLKELRENLGMEVRDTSMFSTFSPVLPEGTNSLREYFDLVLPEGSSFVEYGGPGREVRKGFSPGRIALSAGVTIEVSQGEDVAGHTVIEADMRSSETDAQVADALQGQKPDLILCRMLRGFDVAQFSEEEYMAFLEKWYADAQKLLLVQVPVDHNAAVKKWAGALAKAHPELEVVFFEGGHNSSKIMRHSALRIRKPVS